MACFGALAKRLAFLWRINKSETDPDFCLPEDQHVDRVAIDNTCYASVNSHVLQAKSVYDGLGRILAKNAKRHRREQAGR